MYSSKRPVHGLPIQGAPMANLLVWTRIVLFAVFHICPQGEIGDSIFNHSINRLA
jgi:hypothetical protein